MTNTTNRGLYIILGCILAISCASPVSDPEQPGDPGKPGDPGNPGDPGDEGEQFQYLWATIPTSAAGYSEFVRLDRDASNNVIAIGNIRAGTYSFGESITVNGASTSNPLVAKFNPSGDAVWAITSGPGSAPITLTGVACSSGGEIYIVGNFDAESIRTVKFGGVTITSKYSATYCPFLLKLDASGTPLWGKTVTPTSVNFCSFNDVAIGPSGDVYVVGDLVSDELFTFGPGVIVSAGIIDTAENSKSAFIANYDSSGNAVWAKTSDKLTDAWSTFNGVAVDSFGNAYAVGSVGGSTVIGFQSVVISDAANFGSTENLLIVKFSATLHSAAWGKTVSSGPRTSSFADVAVDSGGNVVAVGKISGTDTYQLGNGVAIASGSTNPSATPIVSLLVAQYAPSGSVTWAKTVESGYRSSSFSGVAIGDADDIIAVGKIAGDGSLWNFGDGIKASTYGYSGGSAVIVQYSASGSAERAIAVESGSNETVFTSIVSDGSGGAYFAGTVYGTEEYTFGDSVVAKGATTTRNAFVAACR